MAFDYNNYYELEYIESNGNQYIQTNIDNTSLGRVVSEVRFKSTSRQSLFGCWGGNTSFSYLLYVNNNKIAINVSGVTDSNTNIMSFDTSAYYTLDVSFNDGYYKINNEQKLTLSGTPRYSRAMWIFCSNDSADGAYIKASACLKSLQTYNTSGTLTYDFRPAKRKSDGVLGLYEVVNNAFYVNSGSGSFIGGTIINQNISDYNRIEYIQGTGTQYLMTTYCPNSNTHTKLTGNGYVNAEKYFYGARTSNTYMHYAMRVGSSDSTDSSGIRLGYNSSNWYTMVKGATIVGKEFEIDINKNVGTLTYNTTSVTNTYSAATFTTQYPLYIFAVNNNGAVDTGYIGSFNLKSFTIWENDILLKQMVPVTRKSDSEPGMYDLVNDHFYINTGTSSFTAGPRVYNLTLISSDHGSVSDSGLYATTSISAKPELGYKFDGWYSDSGFQNLVSTQNPYTLTLTNDLTLYAKFSYAIPNTYVKLNYLQSSRGEYINTGILDTSVYGFEVEFKPSGLACNYQSFFGSTYDNFNISTKNGPLETSFVRISTNITDSIPTSITDFNTVSYHGDSLKFNNTTYTVTKRTLGSSNVNIGIFGVTSGSTANQYSNVQIKYFRLYDTNDQLVAEFLPVMRKSDFESGMYETISGTFFTNAGSGRFVGSGDSIENYKRQSYIESSNSLINTAVSAYRVSTYLELKFKIMPTELKSSGNYFYGGTKGGWTSFEYMSSKGAYWNAGSTTQFWAHAMSINNIYEYDIKYSNGSIVVSGAYSNSGSYSGNLCEGPIVFFGGDPDGGSLSKERLYYLQIAQGQNFELIRNFVPAKRIFDNEIGLYDTVTNWFYPNWLSTGEFTSGGDLTATLTLGESLYGTCTGAGTYNISVDGYAHISTTVSPNEGYIFDGWYLDPWFKEMLSYDENEILLSESATIYPKFSYIADACIM